MKRYKKLFHNLYERKEGAFVPFVILSDPNPNLSIQIIDTFIDCGVDALELGIPFSDPLADGPIIQNANLRAFKSGITLIKCFDLLKIIRIKHPKIPIGLLIYANLLINYGIDKFYLHCSNIGIDSVLIADIPFEESKIFRNTALNYGIAHIFICPPNASDNLLRNIALYGRGYTYLLSRSGVTGNDNYTDISVKYLLNSLKEYKAAPALQGFGISKYTHVRNALYMGAAGVISGSAIVSIIENNINYPSSILDNIKKFIINMKSATYLNR